MKNRVLTSFLALSILAGCVYDENHQPVQNPNNTGVEASVDSGRFETLNKMGWTINELDEVSSKFLEDLDSQSKVLEIGAGFGYVSQKALEKGTTVYVNDLDKRHLKMFKASVPAKYEDRVVLVPGKFPSNFKIKNGSLDAILAQRVLHYLSPSDMDKGLKLMFDLLRDGGKVYVTVDSPYSRKTQDMIKDFEMRKEAAEDYPGAVKVKSTKDIQNYMDRDVAVKAFMGAGFEVFDAFYLNNSSKFYDDIRLDGRETVGIIAFKKTKEEVSE